MIKTNKDNLLEAALIGENKHSAVTPTYATGWEAKPYIALYLGLRDKL